MSEDEIKFSNEKTSKLLRRVGLGLFFLAFGAIKFTGGDWFANGPYQSFYNIGVPVFLLYAVGLIQIAMAVAFFTDKHAKIAGWIASAMILSTTIATLPKILVTFKIPPESPPGFLFYASVPLLFMALSEAMKEETPKSKPAHVRVEKEEPVEKENTEKVDESKKEEKQEVVEQQEELDKKES